MAKVKQETTPRKRQRPASTPEGRENQMISYAMDLVEERLLNGTASSQEVVHFLKLGSQKSKKEEKKIELENELLKAKREALDAQAHSEELFEKAINAMMRYSGREEGEPND